MGLSLRNLYLVSQYIPLSNSEAQAIAYHDGMYVPEGRTPTLILSLRTIHLLLSMQINTVFR
jgi:hypothetical protein